MTRYRLPMALLIPAALVCASVSAYATQSSVAGSPPQSSDVRQQLERLELQVLGLQKQVELLKQQLPPAEIPAGPVATTAAHVDEIIQHKPDDAVKTKDPSSGVFPKAWRIPDTSVYLALGGYVKLDFI